MASPRPNVPVCIELPPQRRLRLNKRAKTQYQQIRCEHWKYDWEDGKYQTSWTEGGS